MTDPQTRLAHRLRAPDAPLPRQKAPLVVLATDPAGVPDAACATPLELGTVLLDERRRRVVIADSDDLQDLRAGARA